MTYLVLVYAVLHASLLIWTLSWAGPASMRLWLLRLLLAGMIFDNVVQGFGHWIGDDALLQTLNHGRYCLHAAFLPWLTVLGVSMMRQAGIAVASSVYLWCAALVFTVAAVAFGLYHDALILELQVQDSFGIYKFVSTSQSPPFGTILTNFFVIVMGVAVWRATGWSWMAVGAGAIFALNGATASLAWGFMVGNFAEILFVASLLATERHFMQGVSFREAAQPQPSV
ncbi:MAG: hypothetical protein AAGI11_05230 [Pseudomonadota bacterium]